MQHALTLIDMAHMRSNYAALSLCPPTPTADRALSYSIWQHCLIPVYSTQDTESWGHARRNLIGEGMRLYLLCNCAVLLATCELNPHTAANAPGREINKRPHRSPTTLFCFTFTSCPCSRLSFLSSALHISLSSPERIEIQYVCRDQ